MLHRSTRELVDDLRRGGHLVECPWEVDSYLEMAEIQRRVYRNHGPAVFYPKVKNCRFACVSNLFGSLEQARYIFRGSLERVRRLIELKIDPSALAKAPWRYAGAPLTALRMLPRKTRRGTVLSKQCRLTELPGIVSWPKDGGSFVTLPQVLSEDPRAPGNLMRINLGMYRVQLGGNDYSPDTEVGLHYQIHRGIGVHHRAALELNQPLRVAVSVGGSPAMTLAAVMPLPEGLTELTFAGALAGRAIRLAMLPNFAPIYADADFAIVGEVVPGSTKPEGPFGDHLGYYSLQHDFPVLHVHRVYHRPNAIWPFTVVGRPPQEDTTFGQLIHELTGPIIPSVLPGVREVHAVDVAGVHPLLLAVGSERYMPFAGTPEPAELLTQANAILGNGQLSLAKYLWIANANDNAPHAEHITDFLIHMLERVDWRRDLHFQTKTTIDTLDYSGEGINRGSKVVIAAVGPPQRALATQIPTDLNWPPGTSAVRLVMPGVLAVEYQPTSAGTSLVNGGSLAGQFATEMLRLYNPERTSKTDHPATHPLSQFPLITLVDDAEFTARNVDNWLWVTFTRSNPAVDIDGVGAFQSYKHWGCAGPLVIDATRKSHHAPPLVEDPVVTSRVDAMAGRGAELSRWL